MLAVDGGTPARSSSTLLSISVLRNLHTPTMSVEAEELVIPETLPAGALVTTVQAQDDDSAVRLEMSHSA